jgi:hypothetical protein
MENQVDHTKILTSERFELERSVAVKKLNTTIYTSYGATMRGYILIPDDMLNDLDKLVIYLNESYDYVMSLEPK